jgi:hypothetical protein
MITPNSLLIFFETAEALAGANSSRLPGRQRLVEEFRRRSRARAGSPDVCSEIVRRLRTAGTLVVVPNASTELKNGVTIGHMLRVLRAAQQPLPRTRKRKQAAPCRAIASIDFYSGPKRAA